MAAVRWQFWFGFTFFICVLAGAIGGGIWLYNTAMDANEVPLKRLVVQGDLKYVTPAEVRTELQGAELGSFFSANVDDIRQRVEAMAWVRRASVRKEWPDILQVYVVEQRPLAHWNAGQRSDALVNEDGEVFSADKGVLETELPYLAGPEHAVDETIVAYRQAQELLQLNGHSAVSLQLSDRFAVTVILASGIELRLGREGLLERMQRFIDLYPRIVEHKQQPIESIDLRYDTGVAVRWLNSENDNKQTNKK